ncbi:MAG: hypothetical protein LAN84_07565 [Acidobacteriia bacterium]|nr:hypothetical protein [Terriglobia bacterium]
MNWPAILVIFFGFLSIVWIGASLLRGGTHSGSTRNRPEEQTAVSALRAEPCPPDVVARVFERGDSDFISGQHSPEAEQLFRRERKRLAYLWLRHTRHQLASVRRFHAGMARKSANLNPAVEIRIVFDCALVSGMCWLLAAAIYFFGPVHARGMARYTSELSVRLWSLAGKSAEIPQSPPADFARSGG